MKCKHCTNELPAGMTTCPVCGGENPVEKAPLGAGKIALLVVLVVAAIAVIAALVMGGGAGTPVETTVPTENNASAPAESVPAATIPADGNPDDVTCKGSYTVSDEDIAAAASTVVATMGESKLTNAELQVYYWMQVYDFLNQYAYYASSFGLDYTQGLDTQLSLEPGMTWQQYFLDCALDTWTNYQAMSQEANAAGFVLDQEYVDYLAELPQNLELSAAGMGFASGSDMIRSDMGPGATLEGYLGYLNSYYLGYMYYEDALAKLPITDADVEAYFEAHAAEYLENGLEKSDESYVDVRHILIAPEGGTVDENGVTTFSDAEWAAAEERANEVLNEWLSGEKTEDSFSALAQVHSVDPGSATNGGLYEDVYMGQMVEPFEKWCFDAARFYGDYGIVRTDYGFHIMYFVGSAPVWYLTAEADMMVEKGNEFLSQILEKHTAEIDYSAIALGFVDLAAAG